MKKYIIFIALILSVLNIQYKDEEDAFRLFQKFMIDYNKQYSSIEELMERYRIFRENLDRPLVENAYWKEGITKFFDMTPSEFKKKYLTLKPTKYSNDPNIIKIHPEKLENPPNMFNWVDEGVLSKVQDQESCGSCWAFSTCGNVEGLHNIKHGVPPSGWPITCSEQNLVDCDKTNDGCDGGDMVKAAKWIQQNGGIMEKDDYPYARREQRCQQDKSKFRIKVTGVYALDSENEEEMRDWLVKKGPLSVGLNARLMQFYKEGIIHGSAKSCNPDDIDHGVVLVGYGEGSSPYWICKNSWGERWGEQGYFRIERGKGTCGINKMVSSAEVE